jgi:PAS fold
MPTGEAEANHLRHLIEKQPACLLRVRRDGVLLACNEAGLSLLGRDDLTQVLDRAFVEHLEPDYHEPWREFAERVWTTGSGSVECGLVQRDDEARAVLFHATALHDHPDGAESVLLAARDTSEIRRLELALASIHTTANPSLENALAQVAALESELARATGETTRLAAALEEQSTQDAGRAGADDSLRQQIGQLEAQLRGVLDEKGHLESLVDAAGRERQRRDAEYLAALAHLKGELDRAREEIERRNESDRHHDAVQREVADLKHALAEVQASLERANEEHRQALEQKEREAHGQLAVLEAQLAAALDEKTRQLALVSAAEREVAALRVECANALVAQECLSELVDQHSVERGRLEAKYAAAVEEAARLPEQQPVSSVRDHEREELIAGLQAEVAIAVAEQKRVGTLLARAEAEQQRLVAGHAADRAEAERTLGEAIFKKNETLKTLTDQRIELQQWFDQACTLEPLAATGRLAVDIAGELQTILTKVDDRAQFLLGLSQLEASYRPEVEGLRAEALRAASLARQLGAPRMDGSTEQSKGSDTANASTEETAAIR